MLKQEIYIKEKIEKNKLNIKNKLNRFFIVLIIKDNSYFTFISSLLNLTKILFIFSSSIENQPIKYDIIVLTDEA